MSHTKLGRIEVLCGPMFGGKTEELIRLLRREEIAKRAVQVFKPVIDNRYDVNSIVSHCQIKAPAITFDPEHPEQILELLDPATQVVGIDEVQWCAPVIVTVCDALVRRGIRVILAGLDMDSSGNPFGSMPLLMTVAEDVTKLPAICTECGAPAHLTQRLVSSTTQREVGGADKYAARCRLHHTC